MANTLKFITLLLVTILALASCGDKENECDNACLRTQVQLLNCTCVDDADQIVPHPCPDQTCPAGQSLVVMGGNCSCEFLA